jgi:DNA-binding transcriptional LysR family regulator
MPDRVESMQVFARIAALGSLSAAARSLGISPTMAAKHLSALETRLDSKLINRTTRRLTLTEAGRNYLEKVERILSDIEEAEAAASADTIEVRGTLRLSAPVSFGVRKVAPLLPRFGRKHRGLTIELGLNDRHVDLIEEGWDMAIRIGNLSDSTMIARRLAPCPLIVCASPEYLARHGKPRKVADLSQHNCLDYTLSRSIPPGRWPFGKDGKVRVAVRGTLHANNGEALVAAALEGHGIVYQPRFLVEEAMKSGRLVALKFDHDLIALDGIFAVYPANRKPPAKVRTMIEYLAVSLN